MSRSQEEEGEADELLFFEDDEPLDDLDEDAFEELELLDLPSAGSKANTIS